MIFGGSATRIAAFALMALIWGVTWLPMKLAAEVVPPIFLAAVRFLLAGLCFLAIALARGLPLRAPRFGRIVVASLLITTGCYAFVFWGVANAPTRHIGDRQPGPDADLPRGDRGLLWAGADHQAPRRRDRPRDPRPRPLVLRADGHSRERHAGGVRPRRGRGRNPVLCLGLGDQPAADAVDAAAGARLLGDLARRDRARSGLHPHRGLRPGAFRGARRRTGAPRPRRPCAGRLAWRLLDLPLAGSRLGCLQGRALRLRQPDHRGRDRGRLRARAVRLGGGGRRRGDAHRDGADLDGKGGGQNRSRSRPLTPAEVSQRTGPRVWGSRKRVGRPSPRIKSGAVPINDNGLILRTFLSKG